MAVIRDEFLSRSVMLLCLGTAVLLLATQGRDALPNSAKSDPADSVVLPSPTVPIMPTVPVESNSIATAPATGVPGTLRLVVDLSDRRVYLYQHQQLQTSYPLAVGQPGWETPVGTFKVFQMQVDPAWKHPITGSVVPPGPDSPLGSRWIGFWSDGKSLIGFHGTNEEALIGQAVSHGCLRMRNRDIVALYQKITLETPVTVQP